MAAFKALLVATLVSSLLLVQGKAPRYDLKNFLPCCRCNCYIDCMKWQHPVDHCYHCYNASCSKGSTSDYLVSRGLGVAAVAGGGGGLDKGNGTETGAAAAPSP